MLNERYKVNANMRIRLLLKIVYIHFCCALLLPICSAHSGTAPALVLAAPLELQVSQRTDKNQADVVVAGVVKGEADVIEVKAELATGIQNGEALGWTAIAKREDMVEGNFSGRITLKAGGWYTIAARARHGEKVVAEASIAKVGVGDVFVTAGQSNSANFGNPRQMAKDDRVVYFNGKTFVPAMDPIPGGCGRDGSVWPILGDQIAKSQQVPVCFRSASLTWTQVKNWMPGVQYKRMALYDNLVKCIGEFPKGGVRAVLWHQGESDSLAKTPAETYCERLKTIIESLNKDAGYPVPWFVAQASFHPGSNEPEEQEVAKGQKLLWEKGLAKRGPNTDELGPEYRNNTDKVHFNQRGLTAHAGKWFEALVTEYQWKP
jgi:eukaryotic-like serine/threonine-protein kinase